MPNSRHIILVDDDPVTIQLCNMIFKRMMPSTEIMVFENGFDALEWMVSEERMSRQNDEFILFLDLTMPVLDGWGFLKFFVKLPDSTREKFSIYILTSSIDNRDIDRTNQFNFIKGFYSKPLTRKMIEEIFTNISQVE